MTNNALPQIDAKAAEKLVTEMIAIPGKSGEEGRVVEFIKKKLKSVGIRDSAITTDGAHKKSPAGGEVGNLIVKLPGTVKRPRRLMMAHIDTVPLCVGARPVREGGHIVSRDKHTALGGDDRAGASVVLHAAMQIARKKLPHPPLTLFWPVQEEIGLYGARFVTKSKLGNPELCFNWDGGDPTMAVTAATGDYAIDIEIEGIASHAGGRPESGVSAITVASKAITALAENGWHGLVLKGNGAGTSNVGIIQGGDATNVVTPHVTLKAEARSHDPEFRERIVEEYRQAFEHASKMAMNDSGRRGRLRFKADLKYEAFAMDRFEPCVRIALAAVEAVGEQGGIRTSNGGLDANWLFAHGLPTVTLGCGQEDIHTVDERLDVDNFLQACRIGLVLGTGTV